FLPAKLIPRCKDPAVEVRIDGTVARLDQKFTVTFDRSVDPSKQVSVTFLGEHVDPSPIEVTVEANKPQEVSCIVR
ncbi:MAG: hypothetical protein AB7O24_29200, partial [Kofleriaceae bacterium]